VGHQVAEPNYREKRSFWIKEKFTIEYGTKEE
jgi:hypothetical protein